MYFDYFSFNQYNNSNKAFHVTPYLSDILNTGAILPRSMTGKQREGLGGRHSQSFSAYNNFESACNTLMFLDLIRMITTGEINKKEIQYILKKTTGKQLNDWMMSENYSPSELASQICYIYQGKNPVVFTSYIDVDIEDLSILCFDIKQSHLFIESWADYAVERNLPLLKNKSFRKIVDMTQMSGIFGRNDFYNVIGNSDFDFDPLDAVSKGDSPEKVCAWYLTGSSSYYSNPIDTLEKASGKKLINNSIEMEDLFIDLSPKRFMKSDSYTYSPQEYEYRFFSPEVLNYKTKRFNIYDIRKLAQKISKSSICPLIWPYTRPDLSFIDI